MINDLKVVDVHTFVNILFFVWKFGDPQALRKWSFKGAYRLGKSAWNKENYLSLSLSLISRYLKRTSFAKYKNGNIKRLNEGYALA